MLPPGQIPRADFPRFGLPQYADRYPARPRDRSLTITLPIAEPIVLTDALTELPRTTITTDFHCVTTWSKLGVTWSGVKFSDFYNNRVASFYKGIDPIKFVVLRAQDGYKTTMLLEDLLADDVLLADELNGEELSVGHGAPLRLIAPQHYGYKSLKHLATLELYTHEPAIKSGTKALVDHPRARVVFEERGRWLPGWMLRWLYRPLITRTANKFRLGMLKHEQAQRQI